MGTGTRGNSLPLAARGIWEGIEGVAVLFCTRLATMLPYYTCRTVLLVTPHHKFILYDHCTVGENESGEPRMYVYCTVKYRYCTQYL